MAKKKVFVIRQKGLEYDDEYNYYSAGDGAPVSAFRKKENADDKCAELNEEFRKKVAAGKVNFADELEHARYDVAEIEIEDDDLATYASAREAVIAAREQAKQLARGAFEKGAAELFAALPKLQSFSWRQYTPYFNDGDECTFSVRSDYPNINGVDGDEIDRGIGWDDKLQQHAQVRAPGELGEEQTAVIEFLTGFEDDDMREMFGDHQTITVKRGDGGPVVETEGYDHD